MNIKKQICYPKYYHYVVDPKNRWILCSRESLIEMVENNKEKIVGNYRLIGCAVSYVCYQLH